MTDGEKGFTWGFFIGLAIGAVVTFGTLILLGQIW